MDRIVRAVLEGDEAAPGRVPASDVARLVLGVQSALRRAAYVVLGRTRTAAAGRYEAVVEEATKLRFVRVEPGSFAGVLALPEVPGDPATLDVDVALQDLGYRAFQRLLDDVQKPSDAMDQRLASAIAQLADDVNIGGRTRRVRLESLAHGQQVERSAVIDDSTRRRMREIAARHELRPDMLYGRLVEADFERRTARLRQPTGDAVTVTFEEDLDNEIQAALREPNTFAGDVTYDRKTDRAVRVQLRAVVAPGEQLELSGIKFHRHRTIAEMAKEQGAHRPQDLDTLSSRDVDANELAAFVAAAEQS
jgi:hypothetical protein